MEDRLAERGVFVGRDRPKPNDKWNIDEAAFAIGGEKFQPWRVIDADGDVLDILVQAHRIAKAATHFFSRLVMLIIEPVNA